MPGAQKLPTGQWVNLVTTIDGKTITYYVNGAAIGSAAAQIDLAAVMHADGNSTSGSGTFRLDRLRVTDTDGTLKPTWYEAEAARVSGTAKVAGYPLASGAKAVTDIGGGPGNSSTLTFDVAVPGNGAYAMTVRYSNPEQSPASHYNPDPLARHAEISVNGAPPQRTWFRTPSTPTTSGSSPSRSSSRREATPSPSPRTNCRTSTATPTSPAFSPTSCSDRRTPPSSTRSR